MSCPSPVCSLCLPGKGDRITLKTYSFVLLFGSFSYALCHISNLSVKSCLSRSAIALYEEVTGLL